MRLERKRDLELDRRKGLAIKTIVALIWFGLCFAAAYFLVNWLLESETITYGFFYSRFQIPRSVSQEFILIGLMFAIVFLIQFFVVIGYAFASPIGRLRPGKPSVETREPDPNADHYDYR